MKKFFYFVAICLFLASISYAVYLSNSKTKLSCGFVGCGPIEDVTKL